MFLQCPKSDPTVAVSTVTLFSISSSFLLNPSAVSEVRAKPDSQRGSWSRDPLVEILFGNMFLISRFSLVLWFWRPWMGRLNEAQGGDSGR